MSNVQLTEGILPNIMLGAQVSNPILQVLGCKKVPGHDGAQDRHRLLLSDSKYMITFAMLAAQLNDKVAQGELANNSVIIVRRYLTSKIPSGNQRDPRRILVILELDELVSGHELEKIGAPVTLTFEQIAEMSSKVDKPAVVDKVPSPVTTPAKPKPALNSSMNTDSGIYTPIETLNPYNQKWMLKVRVTSKSAVRNFSNSKGQGKLFSMNLCDETGEIRATGFGAEVDKFYDMIEIDKAYFITGGQIKLANKQFNNLNNDYEITLSKDTAIQECPDNEAELPKMSYNFIPIDEIASQDLQSQIDVIGVCKETTDCISLVSKAGKDLKKRELTLIDQSNTAIALTLWGQEAMEFDGSLQPVIAIKSARLSEFMGGRNLGTSANSTLRINPDIPEAHKLRGWYDNQGLNLEQTKNLSSRSGGSGAGANLPLLTIQEAKDIQTQSDGKLEFQTYATILFIKNDNCVYKACSSQGCNKKLDVMGEDSYRCAKCNTTTSEFSYRLLMNLSISDNSAQVWVTCFANEAEKILGKTSQEIGDMLNDPDRQENGKRYIMGKNFQHLVFKCRSAMQTYLDEQKLKTVVMAVEPCNSDVVGDWYSSRITKALEYLDN